MEIKPAKFEHKIHHQIRRCDGCDIINITLTDHTPKLVSIVRSTGKSRSEMIITPEQAKMLSNILSILPRD